MPASLCDFLVILKLSITIALLGVAVYFDIRKRTIPNILPILMAVASFIPPLWPHFDGLVVGLLLFIIAVTTGGIGGGDIKLISAVGLMLGFEVTAVGVTVGLVFLLLFHVFTTGKLMNDDKAYPLAPFLTAGLIVGYLIYL